MGYKLLGYIVWRAGKWYARKRAREARGTLAIWAAVALVIAGLLAAPRRGAAK
jgi:sulfite exporter TauE/SafE